MVTTRRNAASADASLSASQQGLQKQAPAPEPPKKKGRKGKAATRAESRTESQPQANTKVKAAPRAPCTDVAGNTVAVSKRVTRADRAAGVGSPFRAYEQPKKRPEKKRKRTNAQASVTPEPESTPLASTQDENDEEPGMFFSESEQ